MTVTFRLRLGGVGGCRCQILLAKLGAPFRPERIAQPDQRQPHRHRHFRLVLGWKQSRYGSKRGASGQQYAGPARQDLGAEGSNAKEQSAEDVDSAC
ncbi:MAG: hypothetical protein R2932_29070 [Caldilineaceae bacterium]